MGSSGMNRTEKEVSVIFIEIVTSTKSEEENPLHYVQFPSYKT